MSEDRATYIPCAAGAQTQTDFLIRPHGALVEILGHPTMHLTPQDARSAALALLAWAGRADGRKTPHGASEAVVAVVVAARTLVDGARWTRDEASSSPEVFVTPAEVAALRTALEEFV